MSSDSTKASKPSKPKRKSKKFPLGVHKHSQQWTKKVRGVSYYFGSVAKDPTGELALERWMEEKDDLLAGRTPRPKSDSVTLAELCNQFLTAKEDAVATGELLRRTFRAYHDVCARVLKILGKNCIVSDITAADLRALRTKLSKGRGLVTLKNLLTMARSIFIFAFDEHQIALPYKKALHKPKPSSVRKERQAHKAEHGLRQLEADEIRQILADVNQPLKSMILLGINGGLGNSDLSSMPLTAVDLDRGWLDYPRPKTSVDRRIPLWPETVQSIREWLEIRPKAKHEADKKLLFLTPRRLRWVRVGEDGTSKDSLVPVFNAALNKHGMKRKRLSFYSLRHCFQTVGSETTDEVAVSSIMGHVDNSMSAHYRQKINDDRLQAVTEYVRRWLFDNAATDDDTDDDTPTLKIADGVDETPDNRDKLDAPILRVFAG